MLSSLRTFRRVAGLPRLSQAPLTRSKGPFSQIINPTCKALATRRFHKLIDPDESPLSSHDKFVFRHCGPNDDDVVKMLDFMGLKSLDDLIEKTVPAKIKRPPLTTLGKAESEIDALRQLKEIMSRNKIFTSHIGAGYYGTISPPILVRAMLENPSWYTPYTPYTAEIAQGRLEMLLNFQTMVCDLTGMDCSNASLLDEATAGAEAMAMCFNDTSKRRKVFLAADDIHPQTLAVMKTRGHHVGIELRVVASDQLENSLSDDVCGIMVQYPNTYGAVEDYGDLAAKAHAEGIKVVAASDPLALTILKPPGEWGADIVVGTTQRFGVPLGYGGPHAAFLAATEKYQRKMPGRIIGVSRDRLGNRALRLAMQAREQHIRRDKATSNICTAQALLANISAAYAIYHGPKGLRSIGSRVHAAASAFARGAAELGFTVVSKDFFDTVHIRAPGQAYEIDDCALKNQINLRIVDADNVTVAFDETTTERELNKLFEVFAEVSGRPCYFTAAAMLRDLDRKFTVAHKFHRTSEYLTHPTFSAYQTETEMLRYLNRLSRRDLGLQEAMIPLGSCTMKLNATSEMIPITWPEVNSVHPFTPAAQTAGYQRMLETLETYLKDVTGFDAVSFQPNSGAQGEYAGLLAISQYHKSRGDHDRNICLIPTSAHGTNPASAVMAGMKVVIVNCTKQGEIDMVDLKAKAEKHKDKLSALMITYPSTFGVFEDNILDIMELIHSNGGQVYMDGANMNAQTGLCSPGHIGADVCHLNLHKTFCIPHGGGGPGMGPIGVKKHLAPFLPTHPLLRECGQGSDTVAAAPFSSASILPISWMYLHMMGSKGITHATKIAILNANYMVQRLKHAYQIRYTGKNDMVAHEFIIDLRPFKESAGIVEEDVAKRLADYSFHAPTMSWPLPGTLMVEPTESESLVELDRFCDAMLTIREEIREIEEGKAPRDDNVLKNAPHTLEELLGDNWTHSYSRHQAGYPKNYLRFYKFWPAVSRIDNVFGDRNVVCTCPPIESYNEHE